MQSKPLQIEPAEHGHQLLRGLTEAEVQERRQRGESNDVNISTTRTYGQILRRNFFTFINIILFTIGVVMILLGLWGDAIVSVGVVLLNVVFGVVQEFRAKAQLDKIALLTRPKVTVIREGEERVIDPSEIVLDDILVARSGDQIVVDGVVVGEGQIDLDESLLTGESDLVPKREGDEVLSGSICVTGSAAYQARKVGAESFANKLTARAKEFRVVLTPLQRDINFSVRVLVLLSTAIGLLFAASFAVRQVPAVQTVQTAAVIAGLVPAGLILMTTAAYAMGALRMSGKGALIQQSNAVESMSNVDVLCMDKTGTLTANRINMHALHPVCVDEDRFRYILGTYACSTRTGNRTTEALAEGCGGKPEECLDEIPFSSARKWSALSFDHPQISGVFTLGAPEMLLPYMADPDELPKAQMDAWTDAGLRVLIALHHPEPRMLHNNEGEPCLPGEQRLLGVVSFSDELRPEAKETIAGFLQAGIQLKIISGDNPQTVAALARQAGLAGDLEVVSGPELEAMSDSEITDAVERVTIFGRIKPDQKEMLVGRLRERGCYVAMIGDGVNDVLSLKKAHIGVAMQSGSAATRGVADIILLKDSFAALPNAFMEGQRILNGMEDVIRLFLTRALYAALIIMGTAVVAEAQLFPFIPKHASLITLLTVGLPTFMLAAWARPGVPKASLVRSITRFVLPAAATVSVVGLSVYSFYLLNYYRPAPPGTEAVAINISRTALTTVTVLMGLVLIAFVEPPTPWWVAGDDLSGDWRPTLVGLLMLGIYVLINVYEPLRTFFELEVLHPVDYVLLTSVTVLWTLLLRLIWRAHLFERFLGVDNSALRGMRRSGS